MNAIIGGSSLLKSYLLQDRDKKEIKTPYGIISFWEKNDSTVFIQRHGTPPVPPHRINHRGNIWALKNIGAAKIISINSVGSLRQTLLPGTYIVPNDFFSPWTVQTFYEDEARYTVPNMDLGLAEYIWLNAKELNMPIKNGGVYIQTKGPRFETKAEIDFLKRFGHVVGMTMASEATLALECEIPYGSLCCIDNFCNGIAKIPLTIEELEASWKNNLVAIEKFIVTILERTFS